MRALWSYVALHQRMPDCLVDAAENTKDERGRRVLLAQSGSRIVQDYCLQLGISLVAPSWTDLCDGKDVRYAELLREYEALDA